MYEFDGEQSQNPPQGQPSRLPSDPNYPQSVSPATGAQQVPPQAQPTQRMLRIPTVKPMVTYILLALIIIAYLFQMQEMQESRNPALWPLFRWGILDFERILLGEYYRIVSSMFLHLNAAHIGLNAYALWVIGSSIERFFGRTRFFLIYFLAGIGGGVLQFALVHGYALGASGAIFGIFGAQLAFLLRNRKFFGPAADRDLRQLMIMLLINVAFNVISLAAPGAVQLGVAAHGGGFAVGLALAWLIGPRYQVEGDPSVPESVKIVDAVKPSYAWMMTAVTAAAIAVIFFTAVSMLRPIYLITY